MTIPSVKELLEDKKMKRIVALLMFSAAVMAAGQATARPPVQLDVPPIQEEYGNPGMYFCDGQCVWLESNPITGSKLDGELHRRKHDTCADKTRFLMTAEDGSKHCIALLLDSGWR